MLPVIGWQHIGVLVEEGEGQLEEFQLRPAVMTTAGTVTDYLDMPDDFKFIGVLRNTANVIPVALSLYRHRFGANAPEIDPTSDGATPLPN